MDGEEGISRYCHGKDFVEGVIDMLANDVDTTWGSRDKGSRVAILGGEGGEEVVPALLLRGEGICGIDGGE